MPAKNNTAWDLSPDGSTELYLFWVNNGPDVDVSIYLHDIPSGDYARLKSLTEAPHVYTFEFEIISGGSIHSVHTEHFEYQLPPPQQDVTVKRNNPTSQANAVAL